MCVGNYIEILIYRERHTVPMYGTDSVSYGSSGKKGLPALCSVLPPTSNVGVLCCTATRAVLSVLFHTLYNHQDQLQ